MKTRFSVLIPVYNRAELVRHAIDSVLSQTLAAHEVIVVDDGSADQTPEVLRSYGTRIKVIRQTNQGVQVARNRAASMASGEYLCFLDSDDLLLPFALATYDRIIGAFASPSLIIAKMKWFKGAQKSLVSTCSSEAIEALRYRDYLAKHARVSISYSAMTVRKSVFESVGGVKTGIFWADD